MDRLKIAQQQVRSFMSDLMVAGGMQPHEVTAAARLREALALIQEAELLAARPPLKRIA